MMYKTVEEPHRPQMTVQQEAEGMGFACRITKKEHKDTFIIFMASCVAMVTMVMRTHLIIVLYSH
jgi:hypothetical protein